MEAILEQVKQDYEPYKEQNDMNLMFDQFSKLGDYLHTARLGKAAGLTIDTTKRRFCGKTRTAEKG